MAMRKFAAMAMVAAAVGAVGTAPANVRGEIPLGTKDVTLDGALTLRETYDTNPLQHHGGVDPVKSSAMTSTQAAMGLTWKRPLGMDLTLRLDYAPTVYFYHSLPDENHVDHAVGLSAKGNADEHLSYDLSNQFLQVDGEDRGVIFHSPDGPPAMGGTVTRDRRDATIFKSCYKVQYTVDPLFVRPVVNTYLHDWHMAQSATPGYANYTNRADYNGGFDVGYKVYSARGAEGPEGKADPTDLYLVGGYRFGYQYQGRVLTSPIEYSNTYHRALLGFEGRPLTWLKVAFLCGPDFRNFGDDTAPGFDAGSVRFYEEGSLTATFSKNDELTFLTKRWELPGSGGKSIYDDTGHNLNYRHAFNEKLAATVGVAVYHGEWVPPVRRHDWIYQPKATLTYDFTKRIAGELGYFSEFGRSANDFSGRDYDRHVFWIGAKYKF